MNYLADMKFLRHDARQKRHNLFENSMLNYLKDISISFCSENETFLHILNEATMLVTLK